MLLVLGDPASNHPSRDTSKNGYASMHMIRRPAVAATVRCKRCLTLNCSVDAHRLIDLKQKKGLKLKNTLERNSK